MLPFQSCRPLELPNYAGLPARTAEPARGNEPREQFVGGSQRPGFRPTGGMGEAGTPSAKLQALARDGVISPARTRSALKLRRGQFLEDGSEGKPVRQLQRMLRAEGGKLRRDGIFGPQTEREVRRFQEKHKLAVDGIVGPKTLKKLNEVYLGETARQPKPEVRPQPVVLPQPKAETVPKPLPRPEAAVKPELERKAEPRESYGLSEQTLAKLEKSGRMDAFRKLPPQVAGRYGQLSPQVRQQLFQQLSGSTWGVSHREAFVRGSAMGMDTFNMMGDKLNKAASEGKISQREAQELQQDMKRLRALSPEQRSLVAEVIALQQGQ